VKRLVDLVESLRVSRLDHRAQLFMQIFEAVTVRRRHAFGGKPCA